MTEEEVICGRMGWYVGPDVRPDNFGPLTLDRLREVEGTLTEAEREMYSDILVRLIWKDRPSEDTFSVVNASAEQKIKALAAVLRREGDGDR